MPNTIGFFACDDLTAVDALKAVAAQPGDPNPMLRPAKVSDSMPAGTYAGKIVWKVGVDQVTKDAPPSGCACIG